MFKRFVCSIISGCLLLGANAHAAVYRLIFESDSNEGAGVEVFQATYATFDDFLTNNIASQGFSSLDVNPNYSLAGFAYEFDPIVSEVPLPAAGFLFLAGLAGLGLSRRNRM